VLQVVKTSVKVISYKPRFLKEAWLMSPSKDVLKAKSIKENVASKSDSFCEATSELRSSLLLNLYLL
jgi:UV DNA damage repair endonuclease